MSLETFILDRYTRRLLHSDKEAKKRKDARRRSYQIKSAYLPMDPSLYLDMQTAGRRLAKAQRKTKGATAVCLQSARRCLSLALELEYKNAANNSNRGRTE